MEALRGRRTLPVTFLSMADGMPGAQIHDVVVDEQSTIWTAGSAGLANFNGTIITSYGQRDGLTTHGLRALALDGAGSLWIGGDRGVDVRDAAGVIRSASAPDDSWRWGLVDKILATPDGRVYAASAKGLIVRGTDGSWRPVAHEVLGTSLVIAMVCTFDGAVWVTCPQTGVLRHADGSWSTVDADLATRVGVVSAISLSRTLDRVLVGGDKGLVEIDARGRVHRRMDALAVEGPINAIHSNEHAMWVAVDGEVLELHETPESWKVIASYLPDTLANELVGDAFGNVWVATGGKGLAKVSALRSAVMAPDVDLGGSVLSIRPTPSGDLLVGGERRSWRMRIGAEMLGAEIPSLRGLTVWDMIEDGDGEIWVASDSGTFRVPQDGPPIRVGTDSRVLAAPARALLDQPDGMWVGTLDGLAMVGDDHVGEVRTPAGASLGYVYSLVAAVDGRVWIGTLGQGVWVASGLALESVEGPGLSASGSVYGLAETPAGDMIVCQDDRVVLVEKTGGSHVLVQADVPVAAWAALVLGDSLWLGSSSGLNSHDLSSGEVQRQISLFGGPEGWEFTTSRSLLASQDGRALCGTSAGLTIVDVNGLPALANRPGIEPGAAEWTGVEPVNDTGVTVVPAGLWSVMFTAHTNWRYDERDLQFRFRLDDFDPDWSKPAASPTIRYSSLPPGEFSLQGQCHSPLVGWGPAETLATVRVEAKRSLLRRSMGTAREARRLRLLTDDNIRLEQLVLEQSSALQRRSKQVADLSAVLQDLEATDELTSLHNRRYFDQTLSSAWQRLESSRAAIGLVMIDVDLLRWYNDDFGRVAGDGVLIRIGELLRDVVGDRGIVCRYGGDEFTLLIPSATAIEFDDMVHRAWRAVREEGMNHPRGCDGQVTVSVGSARVSRSSDDSEGSGWLDLVRIADDAVFEAKRAGRDQVISAASR